MQSFSLQKYREQKQLTSFVPIAGPKLPNRSSLAFVSDKSRRGRFTMIILATFAPNSAINHPLLNLNPG